MSYIEQQEIYSVVLSKDMITAAEIMYEDRLGHKSMLPAHLRETLPQQSGGVPGIFDQPTTDQKVNQPTMMEKPLYEERKEDSFLKANEFHKEIETKASRVQDFHVGPGPAFKGGVEYTSIPSETTARPITANGFQGTAGINEPTNPLVKDYLVQAQNNSFHPQQTPNKPNDHSLIHSEEADRRAMGLGKGEFTDRLDPNQLQTSTHTLTSAEPLHHQGGDEMIKNRPLGFEETKESLGPYLQSMPAQKEYMTMASKKGDDMTLGQKIMDTAAHGWETAKGWLGGNKHETEEHAEKTAEKAQDTLDTAKDKAAETKEDIKEKALETKKNVEKEIKPEKSTTENIKEKASETWEATKEKASEGLEAAEKKAGEAKDWAGKKAEQGEEALKEAGEKAKKTVTYVSDTMREKAEGLWDKAHDRDEKLYVNDESDKTQFEKMYEKTYEEAKLQALDAKELLEEPHDRAVQLKTTDLHNPIERTDETKNKKEILQENAETAAELLAPRVVSDEKKTAHQKAEEKAGRHKEELGLNDPKPTMTGTEKEIPKNQQVKEASLDIKDMAKDSYDKAVEYVNDKTGHEHFLL